MFAAIAIYRREGSLRELEAELTTIKKSITDIRHCAIIADGSLGELDKVRVARPRRQRDGD